MMNKYVVRIRKAMSSKPEQTYINPVNSSTHLKLFFSEMSEDPSCVTVSKPMQRTWSVSAYLEIQTRKQIETVDDVLEIMGLIIDEYEGPMIKRPIVLSIYAAMGTILVPAPRTNYSNSIYHANLNKRIKFDLFGDEFVDSPLNMSWVRQKGVGNNWFRIRFEVEMKSTSRVGTDFVTLFGNSANALKFPDIEELLNIFGVKLMISGEKLHISI